MSGSDAARRVDRTLDVSAKSAILSRTDRRRGAVLEEARVPTEQMCPDSGPSGTANPTLLAGSEDPALHIGSFARWASWIPARLPMMLGSNRRSTARRPG
jgi:hypothetical protein